MFVTEKDAGAVSRGKSCKEGGPGDKNWGIQWSSASGAVWTGPISLNTVPRHMCTANRDAYLVFKVQSVVGAQLCDR